MIYFLNDWLQCADEAHDTHALHLESCKVGMKDENPTYSCTGLFLGIYALAKIYPRVFLPVGASRFGGPAAAAPLDFSTQSFLP